MHYNFARPHKTFTKNNNGYPTTPPWLTASPITSEPIQGVTNVFCAEMVQAALAWRQIVAGTEPYESNIVKFVTRYPAGLPPYIEGLPVIS
jgi:hypothetical protein